MTDPAAPRLSVLLPTWNAAETVERALASILDEVDVRLEVLVIDDASTDGTADVAASVAERDARVVLIRLPANGGVSNARNRGLDIARGTWLAFLDADDVILPDGLAALMRPTEDPAVRAVIGQRVQFDGDRRWVSRGYDQPDIREPGRKSIASNPGLMTYAAIHGKAFHRSLTEGLRFEGRVLGDQPWTIAALLRAGDGIEVIGDVVYEWWRPLPGEAVGITGASRASTERATEMALRAPIVYAAVSDEVELRVAEPATRQRIRRAYFERLVRSDLGVALDDALVRRDPGTAQLLTAIGAFLESVPGEIVATSTPLVRLVLLPPATRWDALVRSARPSYRAMLAVAPRADPGTARRGPRWWAVRALSDVERFAPARRRGARLCSAHRRRLRAPAGPVARCDRGHGGGGGPSPLARLDRSSTARPASPGPQDRAAVPRPAQRRRHHPARCASAPQTAPATIAAMSCAIRALASPGRK